MSCQWHKIVIVLVLALVIVIVLALVIVILLALVIVIILTLVMVIVIVTAIIVVIVTIMIIVVVIAIVTSNSNGNNNRKVLVSTNNSNSKTNRCGSSKNSTASNHIKNNDKSQLSIMVIESADPFIDVLDTVGRFPLPPPTTFKLGGAMAGTERGYPEPFVLLEPPAQNPGCSCVVA